MSYDVDGCRYNGYGVVARVDFVNVSEVAVRARVSVLARLDATRALGRVGLCRVLPQRYSSTD
jgi:hypothetical protein